jgi:hypothetical protein
MVRLPAQAVPHIDQKPRALAWLKRPGRPGDHIHLSVTQADQSFQHGFLP